MVLRDQELAMAARDPVIAQSYVIAKELDATPELKQYKYIPGINYLLGDARLFILHKKSNSEFRL
jgi:hypothetical protein